MDIVILMIYTLAFIGFSIGLAWLAGTWFQKGKPDVDEHVTMHDDDMDETFLRR